MLSIREQKRQEIETIKKRNIKLQLSDADCEKLADLCGENGMLVSQLLENFIGDLVDGTYSNGSDERDCARAWFDRCMFSSLEGSLLGFLIDRGDEEWFLDLLKYDSKEIQSVENDLEDWKEELGDYKSRYLEENPQADWEQEIESVKKWHEEREALVNPQPDKIQSETTIRQNISAMRRIAR